MNSLTTFIKSALSLFVGLILSFGAVAQCTTPVITSIENSGPICEGESLVLSATGTIGGVSSSSVRMAGIGGNHGNREFDEVFSSGDRTGTIDRISEATFNTYAAGGASALRDRYDVLLFTWASSTSLNVTWPLIDAYLALGGSVFWEDDSNIGDLAPGINGVQAGGSYGCNYVLVSPAPFPVLVDNGVNGCFANHHLKVSSWPTWMEVYIKGQAGENLAIAGIHPGGGRIIVQGPDQDYHAVHGEAGSGAGANQYQFLLNQMDFLTAEQAGFSWTGPNGFTSNEANPTIVNATTANTGVYTATLTNLTGGGCSTTATTSAIVNAVPVISSIGNSGPICEGDDLTLTAEGTIGGVSSSSVRMAGIGGNYGNREFDDVFSSGDRDGTIDRISESTFNTYAAGGAAALRARYDVLLFTWNSNTSLNAPWALIEGYLALGGSVFWEDEKNIADLAPGINGVELNGSHGCNYVLVAPAPYPVLVANGVTGCFVNHHLKVNSFPTWMSVYIKGQYGENFAVAGIHPTGGGRIIVQGPDQDFHAGHGHTGTAGNQYQFLLNQMDFLTAEQAGFSWTGPNGFTSNEANPTIANANNSNAGVYIATLTNSENSSCFATATTTVLADIIAPVAVCKNFTAQLNGHGGVLINATDVDGGSSDNCGIASLSVSPNTFNCSNVGANTVTLTVTDNSGNTASCTATVTVEDNVAPIALCKNLTVQLDATGNVAIAATDIDDGSFDLCGIASLSVSPSSFNCGNVGANTAILTVTDVNGNTASCSSTVTVEDNVAPVAVCQNITIQLDPTGVASIVAADVDGGSTDACGIASLAIDNSSFDCNDVVPAIGSLSLPSTVVRGFAGRTVTFNNINVNGSGTNIVSVAPGASVTVSTNWTSAYTSTYCPGCIQQFYIGVKDLAIDCMYNGNTSSNRSGNGNLSFTAPTTPGVYVVQAGSSLQYSCTKTKEGISDSETGALAYIVVSPQTTLTVTDVNGKTSSCIANITVEDNVAPVAVCQNIIVQLDASGVASITAADIDNGSSDACGIASMSVSPNTFNCSQEGSLNPVPVTLTVTDVNGNSSTCSATVEVDDKTKPTAVCKNITVQLDANGNASIVPTDVDGGSFDNCGWVKALSVTPSTFDCSNTGANTVTLKVGDGNGNQNTCTAIVTVEDNIAPTIVCPGDIFVDAERNDCTPVVTWSEPIADDNCSFSVTSTISSGSEFPVGTTTVMYDVEDASGNTATCSFNVTVTPAPLVVTALSAIEYIGGNNISCFGAADGEATVVVDGGCLPYSYNWSDGQTTDVASGLVAGDYTVTITDDNGTVISGTITLTEPVQLTAEAGNNQTVYYGYGPFSCADLSGSAAGGITSYNYAWSNGANTTETTVCPSSTTVYNFTVTDQNGCVAIDVVTVCAIDVRCDNGGSSVLTEQGNKVMVCHKYDSKNAHAVCIDSSAVAAHLAHGDRLGSCEAEHNCFSETTSKSSVSVEDVNDDVINTDNTSIRVYPNPSTGKFKVVIESEELDDVNVTITSITGQLILHVSAKNDSGLVQLPIDLTNYSNGIYFLKIQFGNELIVKKVVINN